MFSLVLVGGFATKLADRSIIDRSSGPEEGARLVVLDVPATSENSRPCNA
jgi:hypothetical protein